MSDRERGLYQKYRVERLEDPEGKHADCFFFVLDPRHDPHACVALQAYIESCRAEFPLLATDLEARWHETIAARIQERFLEKLAEQEPNHPWVTKKDG